MCEFLISWFSRRATPMCDSGESKAASVGVRMISAPSALSTSTLNEFKHEKQGDLVSQNRGRMPKNTWDAQITYGRDVRVKIAGGIHIRPYWKREQEGEAHSILPIRVVTAGKSTARESEHRTKKRGCARIGNVMKLKTDNRGARRSRLTFSALIFSGSVMMHRYPLMAHASARPMPVFPDVGSIRVSPG